MTAFISYLSHPGFILLSCLLQHFGHIQPKNKDAKSSVSEMKSTIGLSHPPYDGYSVERVNSGSNFVVLGLEPYSQYLWLSVV